MDAERFDALTRALVGRRHLSLGILAVTLVVRDSAAAKKRHKKRKNKRANCPAGKRPCQGHCIRNGDCCSDGECRHRGECATCHDGACQPDGGFCLTNYGSCLLCDGASFTCQPVSDSTGCGPCRVCRNGACVGCGALGPCASCQGSQCLPDGRICQDAFGPCSSCDAATFTCTRDRTPCEAGIETRCCTASEPCCNGVCCAGTCCGGSEEGVCYLEAGTICCSDAKGSGCPPERTCCGEDCVDLDVSPDHCGTCINPCLANQLCVDGGCSCAAYQAGTKFCESANRCILEEQICCGQQVCAGSEQCCGPSDARFCFSGSTCPP